MSYIDTQGMSGPPVNTDITDNTVTYSPMPVKKMTVFTDLERKELKQMMREVLEDYFPREKYEDDSWLYRGTY